jgi:hypothetical protein
MASKGEVCGALENWRADQEAALWASLTVPVTVTAALLPTPLAECVPHYSSHECECFTQEKGKYCRRE